ncbi:MAG: MoxR family ATPase [Candidatus Omnitrophica bacterium]|nr:MoxR family ATPase [Candidatus Omnitrophota bacterium]
MEIEKALETIRGIRNELGKVLVGRDQNLEEVLIAFLSGGHVLLEGPPGTAKTLLVRALSKTVRGDFGRIQFTPDLMPADIIGVNVYRNESSRFEFRPGPLFCHLLLGDEINRAPAKTQSALLEAMQERQVSVDGEVHSLNPMFTVFATQNPIEYEGTYPLPEAQVDRFMFKVLVDYPVEQAEEEEILHRYARGFNADREETFGIVPQATFEEVGEIRRAIEAVHVSPEVIAYITSIVRQTRQFHEIMLGASPRAGVRIFEASRAAAALEERTFVTPDDVRRVAMPALRHRVVLTPESEIEGVTPDECISRVMDRVEVPRL